MAPKHKTLLQLLLEPLQHLLLIFTIQLPPLINQPFQTTTIHLILKHSIGLNPPLYPFYSFPLKHSQPTLSNPFVPLLHHSLLKQPRQPINCNLFGLLLPCFPYDPPHLHRQLLNLSDYLSQPQSPLHHPLTKQPTNNKIHNIQPLQTLHFPRQLLPQFPFPSKLLPCFTFLAIIHTNSINLLLCHRNALIMEPIVTVITSEVVLKDIIWL